MIITLNNKPKSSKKTKIITLAAAQSSHNQSTTGINYSKNGALNKYVRNIRAMNSKTAYEYYLRLSNFQDYVTRDYNTTLDDIVTESKKFGRSL